MYITMLKVDFPQILISSAAVFGIVLVWNDINKKVFQTVYALLRVPFIDKALEERRKRRRIEEETRRRIEEEEERRIEEEMKRIEEEEKAAGKTD